MNIILFFITYFFGVVLSLRALPVAAFILYQAVYFYNPPARWWGGSIPNLPYSFIAVILMCIVLIISWKKAKLNRLIQIPSFRWLYLLVMLYTITGFYAIAFDHNIAAQYYIKMVIIISIAFKLVSTIKDLYLILIGYIYGCWYIGFLTTQLGRNRGGRVEGIGTVDSPDSNGIALAITPSLILCLFFFWKSEKKYQKVLAVIAGAFITNAIVLINSRAAFLGATLGLAFFIWHMFFSKIKSKHQARYSILIVLLGTLALIKVVDTTAINRFISIKDNTEINYEKESAATRTLFWLATLDMAKDYPMGQGYRGFNYYADFYLPKGLNTGAHRHRSVHSSWFETLSEVGYLGLFLFVTMIVSSWNMLKKCKKLIKDKYTEKEYYLIIALQGGFISLIVSISFMNRMRAEVLHWFILFIACAYNIYVVRGQKLDESKNNEK